MAEPIAPPRPPLLWQLPEVHRASTNIPVNVVSHETSLVQQEETVTLARDDDASPKRQQVYRRLPRRRPIQLGDCHDPRGELFICVMLPRVAGNIELYQEPPEDEATLVAVKKFRMDRVGRNENPRVEIAAMQALGDGQHVMGCIEALFDNDHLYIVTPWMHNGDLNSRIPPGIGLPVPEAQAIFKSVVSNLEYLHRNHVCHRDLKPENILMTNNGTSTLLIDMAMSRRIPISPQGHVHHPIVPLGTCGTRQFMPPEIYQDTYFDGLKVDIWSLGITMFFMLTGQVLYEVPHDTFYKHFVTRGGLDPENDNLNNSWKTYANGLQERFQSMTQEELREECRNHNIGSTGDEAELIDRLEHAHGWLGPLVKKIQAVQKLSPMARDLLNGMLKANPAERLTLEEVRQHPWFNHVAA